MWKSWILTAWRNFRKHKFFALINVAGLSLGIAGLVAILLYVLDELKYDRFHANADRIYQINVTTRYDGSETRYSTTSAPLAAAIRSDVPEVEEAARLFGREATIQLMDADSVLVADRKFRESNFYLADPQILNLFTFRFLKGNRTTALTTPNQIILTERIALKYFGSLDAALGKQIMFEGTIPLEVSAVVENYPDQSTTPIELLGHFENYYTLEAPEVREFLMRDWLYNPVSTYALLRAEASAKEVVPKIQALNERYADDRVREHVTYELQPLTDIHLYSDFTFSNDRNAIRYVYMFSFVGLLILLIACINFVNLATVHSLRRAKEFGIRKVIGALKGSLTLQFLLESMMLVFVSFIVALAIVYGLLPAINEMTGKNFSPELLAAPQIAIILIVIFLGTVLGAGLYPAFFISEVNPVAALKGASDTSSGRSYKIRRVLVLIQFTASIILIIFTVVIFRQIRFMEEKPLGFQKDFMLTIPLFSNNPNSILGGGIGAELRGRMNSFETELLKNSAVEAVSVSSGLPGTGAVNALVVTDDIRENDNVFISTISVDYDFIETYQMQLIAGRGFSREAGTDHLEALIANEQAIKRLGWNDPDKALGQHVEVVGKKAVIIGVIKDYHFEGLQQPLRPLLMEVDVSKFNTFSLRLNSMQVQSSIAHVKKEWDSFFPEKVFEYEFLDDQLRRGYDRDRRFGDLMKLLSGMAIFISSLGLFGLAAYIGYQKQKEAGIRKVLGASTGQVFYALSREFIKVMAVSSLLSIPLGYYFASHWLNDFAYRVGVGWIPFVISIGCTALIVFLTTVYQTFKTASVNPVQTIRND